MWVSFSIVEIHIHGWAFFQMSNYNAFQLLGRNFQPLHMMMIPCNNENINVFGKKALNFCSHNVKEIKEEEIDHEKIMWLFYAQN